MKVLPQATAAEVSRYAAAEIAQRLQENPKLVLGLATGRTMEPVYAHLVKLHQQQGLNFSQCMTFNLDEYVGLGPDSPHSFAQFMEQHFFRQVNINPCQTHLLNGLAVDLVAECDRYETLIQAVGGIDLQLLGLGLTGHIGFNEPYAGFASRTHIQQLTPLTRQQNATLFGNQANVPKQALTMGVATILSARKIMLLVTGQPKAAILAQTIHGPITEQISATALRYHSDCQVITNQPFISQF